MMNQQLDGILGIRRIILSPDRGECLSVVGQPGRVDRIEDQEVILEEGEQERASAPLLCARRSARAKPWPLLRGLEESV